MSSNTTDSGALMGQIDRPKRPLTPYNLFFQQERKKLIAEREVLKKEGKGSIGFAGLARTIAKKWKATPQSDREVFVELAAQDRARYDGEMTTWKRQLREKARVQKTEKKKKRKAGDGNNVLESKNPKSSVPEQKKPAASLKSELKSEESLLSAASSNLKAPKMQPPVLVSPPAAVQPVIMTGVPPLPSMLVAAPQPSSFPNLPQQHVPNGCGAVASTPALVNTAIANQGSVSPGAAAADDNEDSKKASDDLAAFLTGCLDALAASYGGPPAKKHAHASTSSSPTAILTDATSARTSSPVEILKDTSGSRPISSPALLELLASEMGQECTEDFLGLFHAGASGI